MEPPKCKTLGICRREEPPKCKTSGAKYAAGKASGSGVECEYGEDAWVYGDMYRIRDMVARRYARVG